MALWGPNWADAIFLIQERRIIDACVTELDRLADIAAGRRDESRSQDEPESAVHFDGERLGYERGSRVIGNGRWKKHLGA